ncbi:MAG: hypothetical protein NVS2B12_17280 [Ktedonobacteraceae bacterium]
MQWNIVECDKEDYKIYNGCSTTKKNVAEEPHYEVRTPLRHAINDIQCTIDNCPLSWTITWKSTNGCRPLYYLFNKFPKFT